MPELRTVVERLPPNTYDEFDLSRLQLVFDAACETLKLRKGDPRRETVATFVFDADQHTKSPDALLALVLQMFRK